MKMLLGKGRLSIETVASFALPDPAAAELHSSMGLLDHEKFDKLESDLNTCGPTHWLQAIRNHEKCFCMCDQLIGWVLSVTFSNTTAS